MASAETGETADSVWVERAKAGDRLAFAALVERYRRLVLTLAWQMTHSHADAEDLAQECFLRAFRCLPAFRGDASFKTWLVRIVTNLSCNWRRAAPRIREARIEPDAYEAVPSAGDGPEEALMSAEAGRRVRAAVAQLPDVYRSVVILREWHSLSYREIAQVLDVPIGTVMSRLAKARERLRGILALDSGVTR